MVEDYKLKMQVAICVIQLFIVKNHIYIYLQDRLVRYFTYMYKCMTINLHQQKRSLLWGLVGFHMHVAYTCMYMYMCIYMYVHVYMRSGDLISPCTTKQVLKEI